MAVPANVPVPLFSTVKVLVAAVFVKIVPKDRLLAPTEITGIGAFVATPDTARLVPPAPVNARVWA